MINLKKIFWSNPYLLPVSKTEKEILEYFLANKKDFEQWLTENPHPRIRFQFYFPTAVDFFFDEFKLFTAYYKRTSSGNHELTELKMSCDNYVSIRSLSWKPFEEVMVSFLSTLEESNKITLFTKTKALYDYVSICEERPAEHRQPSRYGQGINASIATN